MNNFYVYEHLDGDEIVYIGMGQGQRAWRYDNTRSPEHIKWMKKTNLFDAVKCIEYGLSKKEATLLEQKLIEKHQPKYNRKHTLHYAFKCGNFDEDDLFLIKYFMRPFGATWGYIADEFGTTYDIARNSQRRKQWSSL